MKKELGSSINWGRCLGVSTPPDNVLRVYKKPVRVMRTVGDFHLLLQVLLETGVKNLKETAQQYEAVEVASYNIPDSEILAQYFSRVPAYKRDKGWPIFHIDRLQKWFKERFEEFDFGVEISQAKRYVIVFVYNPPNPAPKD